MIYLLQQRVQWLNSAGTGRNAVPSPLVGVPPPHIGVPVPLKRESVPAPCQRVGKFVHCASVHVQFTAIAQNAMPSLLTDKSSMCGRT